ncbi:thioredoxin domain-containing protein [Cardiosporidium cionae]|uniref:Thioredoxin domain-containing protein n=1 Tax=Cardiosporidium cionae TaxID=476202 RepID=A0ABQ7J8L0_9APIC|nr:thioredoxin domain-containing protein [Cardiosporidium cionae]|eukprot:KAF8820331.1 thioredoxin domain-containing protein [Cardiosporidium cionae]
MSANNKLTDIAHNLVLRQVLDEKYNKLKASGSNSASAAVDDCIDQAAADSKHWEHRDDDELYHIRERRIQELKNQQSKRSHLQKIGHGTYVEVTEEEFSTIIPQAQKAACHFYCEEFSRCKIIDSHIAKIAPVYLETRFIKMDARKCPFFTAKLRIRVLPTVVLFVDGNIVHSIVGFDDFGGYDLFPTSSLSQILLKYKAIDKMGDECEDNSDIDES